MLNKFAKYLASARGLKGTRRADTLAMTVRVPGQEMPADPEGG